MNENELRECLLKEAEIVQDIISRMANNSFLIKGWAVTLVVVSLLFGGGVYHHFIAFIPWIIFWVLDAYFLQLEKLYRKLFDWVRENRPKTDEHLLSMNVDRFRKEVPCKIQLMFSKTLLTFYGTLLLIILCVVYIDLQAGIVPST